MADINIRKMKLRAKKLGVLLSDSRIAAKRTVDDCAAHLGISPDDFKAYQKGKLSPSLPLLEALAFYLDIPLNHFWSNTVLDTSHPDDQKQKEHTRRELRQRIIATRLRKERKNADVSLQQVSKAVSIPAELIKQYEMAEIPIPLPELERLASALHISMENFIDDIGQIGKWRQSKDQQMGLFALDPQNRIFITNPDNESYLNLAMEISRLPEESRNKVIRLISDLKGNGI